MRRLPTVETMTFHCPCCGYRQKGYFAVCPAPGCNEARIQQFVRQMRERIATQRGDRNERRSNNRI